MGTELAIPDSVTDAFRTDEPIDGHTKLAPVRVCEAALAVAEFGSPMGVEVAAKQAKVLIGSYPGRQIADPEIYGRAIASVLAEVAPDIGCEAVDRLTRKSTFLPTRAEVVAEIKAVQAERRAIAYRAKRHLLEHERRAQEAAYAERVKADKAAGKVDTPALRRMEGDAA